MDKLSAKKIYGVLGYPAKHSLSPLMHNAAFTYLKIHAEYRIFEKPPQELAGFLAALCTENIHGLNITIPYKEEILKYLQWPSPEVQFIGAANTVEVKEENFLKGWNTDGIGFYRHLTRDLKFNISGKKVILLGAGGAAKAITSQLAKYQAKSIIIYDVDGDKALRLVDKINNTFLGAQAQAAQSLGEIDFKTTDLLINATPVGMQESDPCLLTPQALHSRMLVYDLIYNPPETKLLRLARQGGAQVSNGLGMLLCQGALSFEIWTGERAPLEIMRHALKEEVKHHA